MVGMNIVIKNEAMAGATKVFVVDARKLMGLRSACTGIVRCTKIRMDLASDRLERG